MTIYFNREEEKQKRQTLRDNSPFCERIIWKEIRNKQLGIRFRRQYGIATFVVDFYCPKLRIAIEIDGPTHDIKGDLVRQKQIESLGITFLRFTNQDVINSRDEVMNEIVRLIKSSPLRRGNQKGSK
jgi:very-short-patch-repair endonuclease